MTSNMLKPFNPGGVASGGNVRHRDVINRTMNIIIVLKTAANSFLNAEVQNFLLN